MLTQLRSPLAKSIENPFEIPWKSIENSSEIHWKFIRNRVKIHWRFITRVIQKSFENHRLWIPFWAPLGSLLAPFWRTLGSIWLPLGSILGSLGANLAFWEAFGTGGANCHPISSILSSLWTPFSLHFWSKIGTFFNEKMHWFFNRCLNPFGLYFGSLFGANSLPKSCQNRKRRFVENERLACTRCSFSRI